MKYQYCDVCNRNEAENIMDQKKLIKTRAVLGKLCLIAGLLAFSAVSDILVSSYRKPANSLDVVTGSTVDINGRLYGSAKSVSDLQYSITSSDLKLEFDKNLYSGFWFGEGMWRGKVVAAGTIQSGSHTIRIRYPDIKDIKPKDLEKFNKLSSYTINVHEDTKALHAGSYSVFTRLSGLSPWVVFGVFFPLILIGGALNYRISGILEKIMVKNGQAEIYRISRVEKGFEVYFGLGKKHGLGNGDVIDLLDDNGEYIARIAVENAGQENSTALVGVYRSVKPGYLVSMFNNA